MTFNRRLACILAVFIGVGCGSSSSEDASVGGADAAADAADATAPSDANVVGGGQDASSARDAAEIEGEDASVAGDAASDGGTLDGSALSDGGLADAAIETDGGHYNCGRFETDPGWVVESGFRAVTIADGTQGLSQPVGVTFARGAFAPALYVVDQGANAVFTVDVVTGTVAAFVHAGDWAVAPRLLTTITWDEESVFDGYLYVGDQGTDGDADSVVFRVDPTGSTNVLVAGPGPGLDDIYGLAFAPVGSAYPPGLYVTGDTDGSGVDWGVIAADGQVAVFSEVTGVEGIVFDRTARYGDRLLASRPSGGGYAGDGSITALLPTGTASTAIASGLGGVHGVVIGPGGAFGRDLYAASWSSNQLLRIGPDGTTEVVASQLSLTNYDGNILAFSPDGQVLFVADRQAHRIVCIEPIGNGP